MFNFILYLIKDIGNFFWSPVSVPMVVWILILIALLVLIALLFNFFTSELKKDCAINDIKMILKVINTRYKLWIPKKVNGIRPIELYEYVNMLNNYDVMRLMFYLIHFGKNRKLDVKERLNSTMNDIFRLHLDERNNQSDEKTKG